MADDCVQPERSTYIGGALLGLLLVVACTALAGCLRPGLDPPNEDRASGEPPGDAGITPGSGAQGGSGAGAPSGSGGSGGPTSGAGMSGSSGAGGGQEPRGDAGDAADAGMGDDDDAGTTH
jgi:hypothetical protein